MSKIHFCLDVVENGYIVKLQREQKVPGQVKAIFTSIQRGIMGDDPLEKLVKESLPQNVSQPEEEKENEVHVFRSLPEALAFIEANIKVKPEERP